MSGLNLERAFKRVRTSKRGFTLIEMLVVVAILLILSSIAMYLYQRGLAHAKETVCETNLKALKEAIELYSTENDALPGTLGELKLEHLEKGYAKAMGDRAWVIKACTFLIKLDASDHAYAQFLTYDNLKKYGVTEKVFRCPADHNGGASYGINSGIQGQKWDNVEQNAIVVADCDNYVFNSLGEVSMRHKYTAFGMTKAGVTVELERQKAKITKEKSVKENMSDQRTASNDVDKDKYKDQWEYVTEDGEIIKAKVKDN